MTKLAVGDALKMQYFPMTVWGGKSNYWNLLEIEDFYIYQKGTWTF